MRFAAALLMWCIAVGAGPAAAQDGPPPKPAPILNDDQLFRKYVVSTVGPPGLIGAAVVAGFAQWQHYPDEWGGGASGYGKRWASAYAASAIGNTTKYAVAHFMHQDPSFARCRCTGVKARILHAVKAPFLARTRAGREVFSAATVAGYAAQHMVPAVTWYPRGRVWSEGIGLTAAGIASKMGVNIVREFVNLPKVPKTP